MVHRPLLTEGQQKELDMIKSMSYNELNKWVKQFPICEGEKLDEYTQHIDDMTLEEFVEVYDLIDIMDRIKNCGNILSNDDNLWQ